jgi:hypothetical protein
MEMSMLSCTAAAMQSSSMLLLWMGIKQKPARLKSGQDNGCMGDLLTSSF